jgi:hypothetical protein
MCLPPLADKIYLSLGHVSHGCRDNLWGPGQIFSVCPMTPLFLTSAQVSQATVRGPQFQTCSAQFKEPLNCRLSFSSWVPIKVWGPNLPLPSRRPWCYPPTHFKIRGLWDKGDARGVVGEEGGVLTPFTHEQVGKLLALLHSVCKNWAVWIWNYRIIWTKTMQT